MSLFTKRGTRSRSGRIIDLLGTLLLALVLAIIVWLIAINQEDPIVQDEYAERIPVVVRNLDESLLPLQNLNDTTVRFVLRAPQSSWDELDVSDFTAYIDLAGLDAGTHDVDVKVDVVDPKVDVVSISKPQLRLQLDQVQEKEVPVRVEIMDATAFGYDWQPPVVEPVTVTVSGPSTQIGQVSAAKTDVYLRNAKNQVERVQQVTPINSQGQQVERIEVSPPDVRIVVPVEEWPGRKEVAVRVSLDGQPPAGYRLTSVRANPSTVVLLGNTETLSAVPGFLETVPISITDVTSEIQQRLPLIIPDDVTVLEGQTVDVTVSITPIEGGTTVRQVPVVQGVGAGLEATVALDAVEVILSGPLPLLESLETDDVFVILDLTGLLPGVHTVAPRVVVPDQIRSEGVLPQQVEVVINDPLAQETPTAAITTTVTPTTTVVVTSTLQSPLPSPDATEANRSDAGGVEPTATDTPVPTLSATMTPTPIRLPTDTATPTTPTPATKTPDARENTIEIVTPTPFGRATP